MELKSKWQKIATRHGEYMFLDPMRMAFADEKDNSPSAPLASNSWHNFCMIGLRPFNLRVGCREMLKNISTFAKKGA
jgi:hypothetical protein